MNSDIDNRKPIQQTSENEKHADIVKLALDIGENMLICGGEVDRVEDTIVRVCTAYGAQKTDVFSITSVIIVTAIWHESDIVTQTRRVPSGSRNFDKLGAINELSRRICYHQLPFDEAKKTLNEINHKKSNNSLRILLGSLFASGGFAIFFGGTLRDCLAAMICGIIIFIIDKYIYNNRVNKVVYYMVASFLAGVVAIGTVYIGLGENLDMIMIGCIMLVIPGINFTSAVEDVLVGDTATGTLKLCEAVLLACSIAGGFAASVYLCGGLILI